MRASSFVIALTAALAFRSFAGGSLASEDIPEPETPALTSLADVKKAVLSEIVNAQIEITVQTGTGSQTIAPTAQSLVALFQTNLDLYAANEALSSAITPEAKAAAMAQLVKTALSYSAGTLGSLTSLTLVENLALLGVTGVGATAIASVGIAIVVGTAATVASIAIANAIAPPSSVPPSQSNSLP